jgi:hypothetical protein
MRAVRDARGWITLAVGTLFVFIGPVRAAPSGAGDPAISQSPRAISPLQVIGRTCSLRKICRELSRQFKADVTATAELNELRVLWAFEREPSLDRVLAGLAELTDGRIVERKRDRDRRTLALERDADSIRKENAVRTGAVLRVLREALQAADDYDAGNRDPKSIREGIWSYLHNHGTAAGLRYLHKLPPQALDRLAQGEKVRLPREAVPDHEISQMITAKYYAEAPRDPRFDQEEDPEELRKIVNREIENTRREGLGFEVRSRQHGDSSYLYLAQGWPMFVPLFRFSTREFGLALTRTSPYLQMDREGEGTLQPSTPPSLVGKQLKQDLVIHAGQGWDTLVALLPAALQRDVVSDGYLCRPQSRTDGTGQPILLARKGTPVAEALDAVCEKFEYLWWERDGFLFFRARTWPWDQPFEPSDSFLDSWTQALVHDRPIGLSEFAALLQLTPSQLTGLSCLASGARFRSSTFDRPQAQELLRFFQACSWAERRQLLGTGLLVHPGNMEGYKFLTPPRVPGGLVQPWVLRLATRQAQAGVSEGPDVRRVTFSLSIGGLQQEPRRQELSFSFPAGAGQMRGSSSGARHRFLRLGRNVNQAGQSGDDCGAAENSILSHVVLGTGL